MSLGQQLIGREKSHQAKPSSHRCEGKVRLYVSGLNTRFKPDHVWVQALLGHARRGAWKFFCDRSLCEV